MRLDATTMTVDWVFGRNEDFTGISIAEMPDLVHDLHLEDCPEHDVCMVFYDNGINSLQSRGMEVGLDEGSMTATVLRTWTEDGWYSSALGGIQELDDGDWVIGAASMHLEGVEANDASVVQVTEAGEVVWRMRLGPVPATLYRSRWIAGCDMFSSHTAYCDRE